MARRSSEFYPRQTSPESTISIGKESVFCSKNHLTKIFHAFEEMKTNTELCDIVLRAENVSFSAHLLVLAASSQYFRDKATDKTKELILPLDLKADSVKLMIDYFYSGILAVNLDNAEDLLYAACTMKVHEVTEFLVEYVTTRLQVSSCLQFYSMAKKFGFTDMINKIGRFVDWNFGKVTKTPAFLEISADHLLKIVTSENLRVKREEAVYEAVWKWFKHDQENRLEAAKEIFKEIRYCQISPQYLSKHVIRDLVEREGICKPEVKAALEYYRDYNITTSDGNPRKPKDALYVFSCKSLVVERFDPIKSACVPCRELTQIEVDEAAEHRYAVVVGRNLYTITGNRVEMFDPLGLCWNPCGEGLDVRDKGVCAGKDCVYLVGGRSHVGKAVWKFDTLSNEWESLPDMTTSRRSPGVAFLSNKLYVIGGYGEEGPLATCERLDMKTLKWSAMKPMRKQRFNLGVTVAEGSIYAVGGRNNEESLDTLEIFTPKTSKEWASVSTCMQEARNEFGIAAGDKKIYCLGGRGVTSVEEFDIAEKEWKCIGSMGDNHFCINAVMYPPV